MADLDDPAGLRVAVRELRDRQREDRELHLQTAAELRRTNELQIRLSDRIDSVERDFTGRIDGIANTLSSWRATWRNIALIICAAAVGYGFNILGKL